MTDFGLAVPKTQQAAGNQPQGIEPMMRRLFPGFESQTIWYFTNKLSVSYRMPVKTGIHKELRILDSGSR
jgi:hypothetical protein